MEKHPHAELIKQVVDGLAVAEYKSVYKGVHSWHEGDIVMLLRNENWEWRAKPPEPEKVYPVTQLSCEELFRSFSSCALSSGYAIEFVVNYALRHAVDNGYLLTPEQAKKRCDESFQFGTDEALARMGQEYTAEHDKKIAQAVYLAAQRILDSRMTWAIEHARKAMLSELLESLPAIVKEVKP